MNRRDAWRPVLEAQIKRWEAKSCERLIAELTDVVTYEVEFDGQRYQVEVQLVENTDTYVHVGIAVDDASFWEAVRPLSSSFIRNK
ncbi:MAG: hypothetical protein WA628_03560 [Terriglobales bacterium]